MPKVDIVARVGETVELKANGWFDWLTPSYMDGQEKRYALLVQPYSVCLNIKTTNRKKVRYDHAKRAYEEAFSFDPAEVWRLSVRFAAVMVTVSEPHEHDEIASSDVDKMDGMDAMALLF